MQELNPQVKELLAHAERVLSGIEADYAVLDWAGIGDAMHSRLIVQHLKGVTWITVPKVAPLYKDDPYCTVVPGFSSPWRDAQQRWITHGLGKAIDEIFQRRFKGINISTRVGLYYGNGWDRKDYATLFFGAVGIKRDPSIKHSLVHHGTPTIALPERYIVLESHSFTFGAPPTKPYEEMVSQLDRMGIGTVQVGGDIPEVKGTIDARGMDLYDTFSIVKGSIGFVGRSSGNQSLMCFLPDIPLFEVDIAPNVSFAAVGYHDVIPVSLSELARVPAYYGEQHGTR